MARISVEAAGGVDVVAMLETIPFAEGTSTSPITKNAGYDIIVSGVDGRHRTDDYSNHPFASGRPPILVRAADAQYPSGLKSTASGRYQITWPTWRGLQVKLKLPDFSPLSQDLACIELLRQCGALAHLQNGDIDSALAAHHQSQDLAAAEACESRLWASFPGSTAGQPTRSAEVLNAQFASARASLLG